MSRDHPQDDVPQGTFQPNDWISAGETLRLVQNATLSPTSNVSIATRAHAGLLRANARLLLIGDDQRLTDADVPTLFWWALGHEALTQNWDLGDFETWFKRANRYRAFGVRFHREDVAAMVPQATHVEAQAAKPAKETGGRPMSPLWPEWVAELASLVHEEGIPASSNVDELINRVADRLAERDLEPPVRSTVQDAARAVLRRLRDAGK